MKIIIYILLFSYLFGDDGNFKFLDPGKRGDKYRVWVYLIDKHKTNRIRVSERVLWRRNKNNKKIKTDKYDLEISRVYIDKLNFLGIKVEKKSRWLNAVSVLVDTSQIKILQKQNFIKKIKPVLRHVKKKDKNTHLDINYNTPQRSLDYGNSINQNEQINIPSSHDAGFYGQGVRILYIDTGFDLSHEVFDSINVVSEYDFINNDTNTSNETEQEQNDQQDSHGTQCLSVIAGFYPGKLIGPAFSSEYLLAKTEIVAEEIYQEVDNYVAALEWGESMGADITCASLGYYDWYTYEDLDGNTAESTVAIDIASSLGVLCINSAGNEGDDSWFYICTPSDADSILSVGAVDLDGLITGFSSRGPTYDGRIKPEVCALGSSVYRASSGTINGYGLSSGTSYSAPLVAGVAAIVLSSNNDLSGMGIRSALIETASNNLNPNNEYGFGIVNALDAVNYVNITNASQDNYLPDFKDILNAYPNPFNSNIKIEVMLEPHLNYNISIFDLSGNYVKQIFSGNASHSRIEYLWDASKYSSGIYFVRIANNEVIKTKKITYLK